MIDESSILVARINALTQDLETAYQALESAKVDENLRKRVRVPFLDLIVAQQNHLSALRRMIVNQMSTSDGWVNFQVINSDSEGLLKECFAFVQGALTRSAAIDRGLCQIGDALLMDISRRSDIPWTRFTVLDVGEFFHDMTQIIRLRFPDSDIWSLPIACHEFGHFVEQRLSAPQAGETRFPIKEILNQEAFNDKKNVPYLRELFADMFATYALGPSYACTCTLLRFDRAQAYTDGEEHPSSAKRVYFILATLEKMNNAIVNRPYDALITQLRELWARPVDDGAVPQLKFWHESLYLALSKKHNLHCGGWAAVSALIPAMTAAELPGHLQQQVEEDRITIPDVLNAAWQCRLQYFKQPAVVNRIGDNAKKLCHEISLRLLSHAED